MEYDLIRHIQEVDPLAILSTGMLAMAFSAKVREEVKRRQHGQCDCCGEHRTLQVHHRIPQCQGGSDDINNAVGVCQECHQELDKEALQGDVYPQTHTPINYYPQGNGATN